MNKTMLIGNLGADVESRVSQNGAAVANFSLATSERYKDKDGKTQSRTEWHRIVAFGRLAEICAEHLAKGSKVAIVGRIQTRKWEDKDGISRYTTEIVAREMEILGGGRNAPAEEDLPGPVTGDDVPF